MAQKRNTEIHITFGLKHYNIAPVRVNIVPYPGFNTVYTPSRGKRLLMRKDKLSLVIPLYCKGEHFSKTFAVIQDTVEHLQEACLTGWECVLVDDGSMDTTWQSLKALVRDYPEKLHALRFSRNVGKEAAIRAGLKHASGDVAIIMDGNLQHPPSLMENMVGLWANHDIDVVNAVQTERGRKPVRVGSILLVILQKR